MLRNFATAGLVTLAAIGLVACDVEKTREGNVTVPKYEVKKTQEGDVTLPKVDVDAPSVNVTSKEKVIEVPKIEKKEKTVVVPSIDVVPAGEKEAKAGAAKEK